MIIHKKYCSIATRAFFSLFTQLQLDSILLNPVVCTEIWFKAQACIWSRYKIDRHIHLIYWQVNVSQFIAFYCCIYTCFSFSWCYFPKMYIWSHCMCIEAMCKCKAFACFTFHDAYNCRDWIHSTLFSCGSYSVTKPKFYIFQGLLNSIFCGDTITKHSEGLL
jgi:hypothetical protein